ncbi:uncharacterized protein LOC128128609 [Lactuca sativa]|uniref:Replication factor A C-terminal domain-containing protein n=1 Tax=Lactuca sativa TaxID=4236 RepID=A0A9R1UDS1_LACSA|nr:uncharacterized protein LOC128128609 [Lactuca sativa]KAJ0185263.1 hypothetical protein LSAT_V11C900467730 [Lactuca sativa]
MVKASITEFVFQDSWCQITCPTCRDPIFKRGAHWFCSAHRAIEKPSLTHRFSVMITDTTDTLQAIVSDTSSRKILSANPETSLPEINSINRKVLPTAVTKQKGEIKNMSIQMLRTSTSENLRFIIIDLQPSKTVPQTTIPATPSGIPPTRSASLHTPPDTPISTTHAARNLSFTTNGMFPMLIYTSVKPDPFLQHRFFNPLQMTHLHPEMQNAPERDEAPNSGSFTHVCFLLLFF